MFSAFPVIRSAAGGLEKALQIQIRSPAGAEQADARHADIARASGSQRAHGRIPGPKAASPPPDSLPGKPGCRRAYTMKSPNLNSET